MAIKYTVEQYGGERSVVGRYRGAICETYACGDMDRAEAVAMARGLAAEQAAVERIRDREEV